MGKAKSRPCRHPLTAIRLVTSTLLHCRKCNRYATVPEVNNELRPIEEVPEQGAVPEVGEVAQSRLGGLETDTTHPEGQGEDAEGETEATARIITVG